MSLQKAKVPPWTYAKDEKYVLALNNLSEMKCIILYNGALEELQSQNCLKNIV